MKAKIQKAIDLLQEIKDEKPSTLNLGRTQAIDNCLANLASMRDDTPESAKSSKKSEPGKTEPEPNPESPPAELKQKSTSKSAEDRLTKQ